MRCFPWVVFAVIVGGFALSPVEALAQREQVEDTVVADDTDARPLFEKKGAAKKSAEKAAESDEADEKSTAKSKSVRKPKPPLKNRYSVADPALELADPRTYRLKVLIRIAAPEAEVNQIVATGPIPMEWPEQKVRLLSEKISPSSARVSEQVLPGQAAMLKFTVPHIGQGKEAFVERMYEITRYRTKFTLPIEDLFLSFL